MEIKTLTDTLFADDSLEGVSRATGASTGDVLNVLAAALPALLNGANTQATQASTQNSFANALQTHAKDDTSNLLGFLSNANSKDGNAILSHLLGANQETTTNQIAQQTGVSKKNTNLILAAIAPLLLSLLGKSLQGNNSSNSSNSSNAFTTAAATALMSSLLGGNNASGLTSILSSLLGAKPAQQAKPQQSSGINPLNLLSGLLNVNPNRSVPTDEEENK